MAENESKIGGGGPSVTEIREFLTRTDIVNLDTSVRTLLDHASLIGGSGNAAEGYVFIWDCYAIVPRPCNDQ